MVTKSLLDKMHSRLLNFYHSKIKETSLGKYIILVFKYKRLINSVKKNITGKNNSYYFNNSILNNVKIIINGNKNKIIIDDRAELNNVVFNINGDNHYIHIHKNCIFSRGGSIWFEDNNGKLIINKNCLIENVHFAVTEPYSKIEIGKSCLLAYDIDIRTGDSHSILDVVTGKRINYAKDIKLGEHIWVGAHTSILKGVEIGDNNIVASRSVITKSYLETNSIIAGVPAKIVKQGIKWCVKRIYEK